MKSKSLLFPLFENFQNLGASNSDSLILSEFIYFLALQLLEIKKLLDFGLSKTWQSSQKNTKISLIYTTQSNPRYSQFFLKKETKFVRKSGWSEQVL
jgi:hypothetical protein